MALFVAKLFYYVVRIFIHLPRIDCLCDYVYCIFTGCVQAQQEAELDFQNKKKKMTMEYNEQHKLVHPDDSNLNQTKGDYSSI